jgi:ribosomal protein S18
MLCKDRVIHVDYKDTGLLRRFMSERGKIKSRSSTGTCTQHQAAVALAIKNSREMALLPYVVRTLAGDKGGRRRGGPGGGRSDGPRPDGPRPDRVAPVTESALDDALGEGSLPEPEGSPVEDGAAVVAPNGSVDVEVVS